LPINEWPLWVTGCLCGGARSTTGVPQIAGFYIRPLRCDQLAIAAVLGQHEDNELGYYDGRVSMMASGSSTRASVEKDEGIVTIPNNHSVDETVDRLKTILQSLQSKGIMIFALVDHSGEAAEVELKMPPTKLLIFANPQGGTPLMLAAPSIAID
jgi:hypothetical protein